MEPASLPTRTRANLPQAAEAPGAVGVPRPTVTEPSAVRVGLWRLRGRWRWVAIASAATALLGLIVGLATGRVSYDARAMAVLRPLEPTLLSSDTEPTLRSERWDAVIEREAELLRDIGREQSVAPVNVAVEPGGRLLITAEAGDAEHAQQAVAYVIEAYPSRTTLTQEAALHDAWMQRRTELNALAETLHEAESRAATLEVAESGRQITDELEEQARRIAALDTQLQQTQSLRARVVAVEADRRTTLVMLRRIDPQAASLIEARDAAEDEWRSLMWPPFSPLLRAEDVLSQLAPLDARVETMIADSRLLPADFVSGDLGVGARHRDWVIVRLSLLDEHATTLSSGLSGARSDYGQMFGQVEDARAARREADDAAAAFDAHRAGLESDAAAADAVAQLVDARAEPASTRPASDTRGARAWSGLWIGALMGGGVAMVVLLSDRRLRRADPEPWQAAGAPLLGAVPDVQAETEASARDAGQLAAAVHEVRAMIEARSALNGLRSVSVTSVAPGSGNTSLSLGLGCSLAMAGMRVLLVDANLARASGQSLDEVMARVGYLEEEDRELIVRPEPDPIGLKAYLRDEPLRSCAWPTRVSGLSLLAGVGLDETDLARLSTARVQRLGREIEHDYDLVLWDTGSVADGLESLFVAGGVDGVVMLVGRGQLQQTVDAALHRLRLVGAELMGTVFNLADEATRRSDSSALDAGESASWQNQGSGMYAAAVREQSGQVSFTTVRRRPEKPVVDPVEATTTPPEDALASSETLDFDRFLDGGAPNPGTPDTLVDELVDRDIDAAMTTAEQHAEARMAADPPGANSA